VRLISGFNRSAKVEAGRRFGVLSVGKMAHSFVQALGDQSDAFVWFARARLDGLAFVIDSFDTEAAARGS
jgi:nicotinate phosphoribosyltransferase